MKSITDQLRRYPFIIKHGAHHPGGTVRKAGHCIEQMGGMGYAAVKGVFCLLVTRRSVRDGNRALRFSLFSKFISSRLFRRHHHQLYKAAAQLIKLTEPAVVRRQNSLFQLSSLFLFGNKRSLHVDSDYPGAILHRLLCAGFSGKQSPFYCSPACGHRGRTERSNPLLQQKSGHIVNIFPSSITGIGTRTAVDMDIHKAGYNGISGTVNSQFIFREREILPHPQKPPVFDFDISRLPLKIPIKIIRTNQQHVRHPLFRAVRPFPCLPALHLAAFAPFCQS